MASWWKKISLSLSSWVELLSGSVEAARLSKSLSSSAAAGLSVKMTCLDAPLGLP